MAESREGVPFELLGREDKVREIRALLEELAERKRSPGRIIKISGPSGSGKTTTVLYALGLLPKEKREKVVYLGALPRLPSGFPIAPDELKLPQYVKDAMYTLSRNRVTRGRMEFKRSAEEILMNYMLEEGKKVLIVDIKLSERRTRGAWLRLLRRGLSVIFVGYYWRANIFFSNYDNDSMRRILERWASELNVRMEEEALSYVIQNCSGNMKKALLALKEMRGLTVTREVAKKILRRVAFELMMRKISLLSIQKQNLLFTICRSQGEGPLTVDELYRRYLEDRGEKDLVSQRAIYTSLRSLEAEGVVKLMRRGMKIDKIELSRELIAPLTPEELKEMIKDAKKIREKEEIIGLARSSYRIELRRVRYPLWIWGNLVLPEESPEAPLELQEYRNSRRQ
ncbi:MAG: hypothetical protein RMJ06_06760 [Nitrososphaerota archaeon]|nr:hypothetical protein [Nitrososphaerota archaeon]